MKHLISIPILAAVLTLIAVGRTMDRPTQPTAPEPAPQWLEVDLSIDLDVFSMEWNGRISSDQAGGIRISTPAGPGERRDRPEAVRREAEDARCWSIVLRALGRITIRRSIDLFAYYLSG